MPPRLYDSEEKTEDSRLEIENKIFDNLTTKDHASICETKLVVGVLKISILTRLANLIKLDLTYHNVN